MLLLLDDLPRHREEVIFPPFKDERTINDELFRKYEEGYPEAKRNQWFRRMFTVAF